MSGARLPLPLRAPLGLAVIGQLFVLLGIVGILRPWPIACVMLLAIALGVMRGTSKNVAATDDSTTQHHRVVVLATIALAVPLFVLALYPPSAFDETLYHLPFVATLARAGAIRFFPLLRFPAFPQLHELLCVPVFLAAGDTATHLVTVAELLLLAGVVALWPRQRSAGLLAAAVVIGHPIVFELGSVTYVDVALALFVTAGFVMLNRATTPGSERWLFVAAGFLLGTACSVKYLGGYFAASAFLFACFFARDRRRNVPLFVAGGLAAVLPTYACITALTGSPLFPFAPRLFGVTAWTFVDAPAAPAERVVRALRLFWNITFARDRVNYQPPYAPTFAVALLLTFVAATRNRRAAFVAAMAIVYIIVFTFLPQDSRYLLSLLPVVSVVAAGVVTSRLCSPRILVALMLLAVAPGLAYAAYRVAKQGPPPVTGAQRRAYLERRLPEYRAFEHRGEGRIFACGAEQLKHFGGDQFFGEMTGPWSCDKFFRGDLARNLAALDVHYLLISRRRCPAAWQRMPAPPAFERVYADADAELWRLAPRSVTEAR